MAGFLSAAICGVLAGCSLSSTFPRGGDELAQETTAPVPSDLLPEAGEQSTSIAEGATEPAGVPEPLSVDAAVRFALASHPELAVSRARVEAALGRKLQSGALPNPALSAAIESAPFHGKTTGDAEYLFGVTQPVPIGGRLRRAVEVESAREQRLLTELEAQRRVVERRVRGAFAAALFARATQVIEREMLAGAESAARIAAARVAAGDATAAERARAELEGVRARISLRAAEVQQRRALVELRGALGLDGRDQIELVGDLESTLALPELSSVLEALETSPILRAEAAAVAELQAAILREKAERIPDVDVSFFYRRIEQTDDDAFDVGVSVPVPLFDRRAGALRRAHAEVLEAEARHRAASRSLSASVQTIYWKLTQALETVQLYRDELTPQSQTVLEAATAQYDAGDISLAELIPIQRDHRELRRSYIDLLRQIALDWAEFRSLVQAPR